MDQPNTADNVQASVRQGPAATATASDELKVTHANDPRKGAPASVPAPVAKEEEKKQNLITTCETLSNCIDRLQQRATDAAQQLIISKRTLNRENTETLSNDFNKYLKDIEDFETVRRRMRELFLQEK